jgi:hypothetical protein
MEDPDTKYTNFVFKNNYSNSQTLKKIEKIKALATYDEDD